MNGTHNIVWVISTSLQKDKESAPTPSEFSSYEERKQEYMNGIQSVLQSRVEGESVYIVENNGNTESFLDDFGVPVHYTRNQFQPFQNKGRKEMMDIVSCLDAFGVDSETMVIKTTGRYLLLDDSFPRFVRENCTQYDVMYRVGSAFQNNTPSAERSTDDMCTGMYAMRYRYFKQFDPSTVIEFNPVEWFMAKFIKNTIPGERRHIVDHLGLRYGVGMDV